MRGAASGAAAEERKRRRSVEGRRGSVMKEESQMGQTPRDRLNSVKELTSGRRCLKDKDRCVCVSRYLYFHMPVVAYSNSQTCSLSLSTGLT